MTWVRLSDTFVEHPRWEALGGDAFLLHVAALSYSNRAMTDGYVSRLRMQSLTPAVRGHRKLADRMVAAGLWTERDDGYQVANYVADQRRADGRGDEQPLAERVQKRRTRDADRGSALREKRRQASEESVKRAGATAPPVLARNGVTNGGANAAQTRPGQSRPEGAGTWPESKSAGGDLPTAQATGTELCAEGCDGTGWFPPSPGETHERKCRRYAEHQRGPVPGEAKVAA